MRTTKATKSEAPIREVTQSEIGVFRSCRRKHELRYTRGLTKIRTARPLTVGSAVHEGARVFLATMIGVTPIEVALRFDAAQHEGVGAMRAYLERNVRELHASEHGEHDVEEAWKAEQEAEAAFAGFVHVVRDLLSRYAVVEVEFPFEVKLAKGFHLRGQIDIVLRDLASGKIVLGEIKTTSGIPATEDFRDDVDPQPRLYLAAIRKVYGPSNVDPIAVYVTVRKKGPRAPSMTQKGLVSAAAIDTTREIYGEALANQEASGKAITDEQRARLAQLGGIDRYAAIRESWFAPEDLDATIREALVTAREIARTEAGRMKIVRNGHSCTSRSTGVCDYRQVCDGRSEPSPMLYRLRTSRHEEIVEESTDASDGE